MDILLLSSTNPNDTELQCNGNIFIQFRSNVKSIELCFSKLKFSFMILTYGVVKENRVVWELGCIETQDAGVEDVGSNEMITRIIRVL